MQYLLGIFVRELAVALVIESVRVLYRNGKKRKESLQQI